MLADLKTAESKSIARYRSPSRLTDPGGERSVLDNLPEDVEGICKIVRNATIHHNLLGYYGLSAANRQIMATVATPRVRDILRTLSNTAPFGLYRDRLPIQRILGACFMESHLLASLLRHQGYPVRIRAGYFRNVQNNLDHITRFWTNALLARRVDEDLLTKNPDEWKRAIEEFAEKQVSNDHRIEHWICEYWDADLKDWRLIDANDVFLKALCDLDVGFHLSADYFEYACDAWNAMRDNPYFNDDRYGEPPQTGRSHIRSQLLSDFFSLLNHDLEYQRDTSSNLSGASFVKQRAYCEMSDFELEELDKLAVVMSGDLSISDLTGFYKGARTMQGTSIEQDPYCFIRNT